MWKISHLTNKEWRWLIIATAMMVLLSTVPYLIAALAAPPGWKFAGLLVNPTDGHTYLAKMRLGWQGAWLFKLTYTPEPHHGFLVYTFYLALGHLCRIFHLPLIYGYHLARIATGVILLIEIYYFLACLTPNVPLRRAAWIFIVTGSGLGWLGIIFGALPIDVWVPEAFVAYTLYTKADFILASALMLMLFRILVWSEPHRRTVIRGGVVSLLLVIVQPFAFVVVGLVSGVFFMWVWFTGCRLPVLYLKQTAGFWVAIPLLIYDVWITKADPIIISWSSQDINITPSVLNLALGVGVIGLLAVMGGWLVIKKNQLKRDQGIALIFLWLVTAILAMYLPTNFQRRFLHGINIPLGFLAAWGLLTWLEQRNFPAKFNRRVTLGVAVVGMVGTLFVWLMPLIIALQSPERSSLSELLFIRNDESAAFNWINREIPVDAVILASPRVGMMIPSQTNARTYYGHVSETLNAVVRKANAVAFFRGELQQISPEVDYIFVGPSELAWGQPNIPASAVKVYSNNQVTVFKIRN